MTSVDNLKCVFCSEEFNDKEVLQEHFRKHGDPAFDKSIKLKNKAQNEVPTSTEKMEENEMVGCDVCEEVFPTISKAITHKHKVHPDHDAKYFCPWCGKLFTMKHLYNKHLQTNHEGVANSNEKMFHCDACSVYFYLPSAMVHHNKFFHRQDTELNSIGSSKKVKLYNQELIAIFYCPFCGEEYNNKVNVHKHMEDDHGDEIKSPEEILRCPLCEAFFYHLDAYELHLTFHSSDDLYSEQNEMVNEITEFSLEAVPPIMEKVEDPPLESVGDFLETLLGSSDEQVKVKTKKHKKHKKAKKETMTLDEFLNMNKDVFGDGLNVQGIEEVPTQMVLKKKYKGKKVASPSGVEATNLNPDLAKLKKQGITIKSKSGKNSPSLSINTKQINNQKNITQAPQIKSDPNDVINKLLSQGNSQIKIVKKSVQMEPDKKQESYQSDKIDSSSDNVDDVNKKNDEVSSKKEVETVNEENKVTHELNSEHESLEEHFENKNILEDGIRETEANDTSEKSNATDMNMDTETDDLNSKSNEKGNTLKTLQNMGSHLTIKTLNPTKNDPLPENGNNTTDHNDDDDDNSHSSYDKSNELNILEKTKENTCVNNEALKSLNLNKGITIKAMNENQEKKSEEERRDNDMKSVPNKSLETLKGLSKCITVKTASPIPSPLKDDVHSETHENDEFSEDHDSSCENENKTDMSNKNSERIDPETNETHEKNANFVTKTNTENSVNNQNHHDILKRLKNITAKPISAKKPPLPNKFTKVMPNKKIDEDIEILNIDDSDSDADADNSEKDQMSDKNRLMKNPTPSKTIVARNVQPQALRGLSKNVTVKSMSQQSCNYTEYQSKNGQECKKTVVNRSFESKNVNIVSNNKLMEEQKNLQDTIKHLRRHITIKPKQQPLQSMPDQEPSSEDTNVDGNNPAYEDEDHDSDSSMGKVKITEMDENASDQEHNSDDETRARVESPHDSNSGDDEKYNDDIDDEFSDIESKIKANPIKNVKQNLKTPAQPLKSPNLSHLNKELTIKSLRQDNQFSDEEADSAFDDIPTSSRNVSNAPVKSASTKQVSKNVQSSQKTSSSANQVSTVKTVKTYQSQTVIEEVTTTVTKTIRTVNTQEVQQNATQVRPAIRPQKVMNRPINNVRTTAVRHMSPAIGTKVRSTVPSNQTRPNNPGSVRPSNMIVPARPRFSSPRMQSTNSPNVRKTAPTSQNRPRFPYTPNTPLKIAPHVANTKRPAEDASGHFGCFKKPKESLVPLHDMHNMPEDETVQFSSSQSKSSFTNVTKVVKDNSAASTSQTRSEATMSQQHIAKLSGMSGLKIVKTSSQQKQIEEKFETNTPKNSAIAALEKLQRQGLLIKKPRLDAPENDDEQYSQSGSDEEQYEE